jgi:membrane protein YqaA with SNARE-associated domain
MSSEVVLAALAGSGSSGPDLLLAVAAVGNTLDAVANWAVGRYAAMSCARLLLTRIKARPVARRDVLTALWCS